MTLSTSTTTELDLSQIPDAPENMTMEQILSVAEQVWVNPEGFIEHFLIIDAKEAGLVRFKLNRTQRDILAVIKYDLERGVPVRIAVLKARQQGVSTFVQGLFYTLVTTNPRYKMWIITHESTASENLFAMSELFLDNMDERITPMVRNRDLKRIRFDNPDPIMRKSVPGLGSQIYVDQAKNVNAGRSKTIQLLHISERAFWHSKKTATSLLQAVPALPRTIVVQESTANGVSDAGGFHELWVANHGVPNAAWRCLFFPWFIHEEYVMEPQAQGTLDSEGRLILEKDPDGEMREDALREGVEYINVWGQREMHYINDRQLAFRRWAIKERCEGDVWTFMQEFPSNPQEAFVQSGRPWWSRAGLEAVRKTITPPIARGFWRSPKPNGWVNDPVRGMWREDHFRPLDVKRGRTNIIWQMDDTGDWWIWKIPQEGHEYLVSVDTAEGGEGGDKAAIQVFDRHTLEQVAEFNGWMDTDQLAHQTAMVAWVYNMAWVIPEVNNTGYGFMVTFTNLWPRMYMRVDPDAALDSKQRWIYGFKTGPATRPILVTRGANFIREKIPTIRSARLYDEMVAFVKDKKGIPRAAGGANDDLVMAFLLILELGEQRPVKLEKAVAPVTLWDDKSFQRHIARMRSGQHGVRPKFQR